MPKKIIIFLIILILFISKVHAEDTYQEIKDYEIRYRFYKEINNNKTNTKIKLLTEEETIQEIARISSGEITDIALSHAKELRKKVA